MLFIQSRFAETVQGRRKRHYLCLKAWKIKVQRNSVTGSRSNYRTVAELGTEGSYSDSHADVSVGQFSNSLSFSSPTFHSSLTHLHISTNVKAILN